MPIYVRKSGFCFWWNSYYLGFRLSLIVCKFPLIFRIMLFGRARFWCFAVRFRVKKRVFTWRYRSIYTSHPLASLQIRDFLTSTSTSNLPRPPQPNPTQLNSTTSSTHQRQTTKPQDVQQQSSLREQCSSSPSESSHGINHSWRDHHRRIWWSHHPCVKEGLGFRFSIQVKHRQQQDYQWWDSCDYQGQQEGPGW